MDITGNRELELVFFNYKNNLKVLNLGHYAYNELIWYISEICKKIELSWDMRSAVGKGIAMAAK